MVNGAIIMSFFAAIWFALGMLGAGMGWGVALLGVPLSALTILAARQAQRAAVPRSAAEEERTRTVIGWASAVRRRDDTRGVYCLRRPGAAGSHLGRHRRHRRPAFSAHGLFAGQARVITLQCIRNDRASASASSRRSRQARCALP